MTRILDHVPAEQWDVVAEACPYATFFHTSTWSRIWAKTYPRAYRPATKGLEIAPGRWLILPSVEHGSAISGLVRSYLSNVPGVYGGPISNGDFEAADLRRLLLTYEGPRTADHCIYGNPHATWAPCLEDWQRERLDAHLLELTGIADEEALLKRYDNSARNKINKAVRGGLTCEKVRDLSELRVYHDIYVESVSRWGASATNHYDFDIFRNLFEAGSGRIVFWLVKQDGVILGGNLNLYHRWHTVEWHCAYRREFFKLGIRNFLVHEIVKDALRRKITRYDFCTSGGHEGTERFKEAMGAKRAPFFKYSKRGHLVGRTVSRAHSVVREAVRRARRGTG